MKIHVTIDVEECSYWDYNNHTRTHDCNSCLCASEGNSLSNINSGVMIGEDRYCTLESENVRAEMLKAVKMDDEKIIDAYCDFVRSKLKGWRE